MKLKIIIVPHYQIRTRHMSQKELLRDAPKEARQTIKKIKKLEKRMAKHNKKKGKADGAYMRSVPRWLDWAIPYGGLRIGDKYYVAGDSSRAFQDGFFHLDRWKKFKKGGKKNGS